MKLSGHIYGDFYNVELRWSPNEGCYKITGMASYVRNSVLEVLKLCHLSTFESDDQRLVSKLSLNPYRK